MANTVAEKPAAAGPVDIPGFLVLAGGVPVKVGKATIGAIGGGAPGSQFDEACAMKALETDARRLK